MKNYKKYIDIPETLKVQVYEFFKTNKNNTVKIIAKKFNVTMYFVRKIISDKMYEERKK